MDKYIAACVTYLFIQTFSYLASSYASLPLEDILHLITQALVLMLIISYGT